MVKPMCGWTKCNVAASWVSRSSKSGGAWIARDNNGVALIHSRRAFSNAQDPLTAALISLLWSINDLRSLRMDKIIFETSSYCLRDAFLHPVANAPHRQLITAGAWIARDNNGVALIHSRRAFSNAQDPLTAALISLLWSINDLRSLRMDKIIFETSSYCLRDAFLHPVANAPHRQLITAILNSLKGFVDWRVEHVVPDNNKVASLIAASVTKEHRHQSYVASGGPSWLQAMLSQEADVPQH
ncbi:hypothetical protein F2Q70_00041693 [Brassica cretica]|uniref:RNase H type-1 domain-containing protein n=1 Tax=Brassica cretica TaxID=69181 RepID=A0A8S9K6N8_BRACR|nr:hypothetical protein F2Q70_00041693 [Brassica cretica]